MFGFSGQMYSANNGIHTTLSQKPDTGVCKSSLLLGNNGAQRVSILHNPHYTPDAMPDQKKTEQKPARNTTRASGKSSTNPAGGEAPSSGSTPESPESETTLKQASGVASKRLPAADLETLQQTATDYFNRLTASAGDLTTQARRVYDSSQSFVRSHPGQTVGGGFLAGLVLGLLMGRD